SCRVVVTVDIYNTSVVARWVRLLRASNVVNVFRRGLYVQSSVELIRRDLRVREGEDRMEELSRGIGGFGEESNPCSRLVCLDADVQPLRILAVSVRRAR